MEYRFSPEQEELRTAVRRLLADRAEPRAVYDGGPAVDRRLWSALAEAGVCGLGIAETDGGSGGGLVDQVVVAEELGRAVAPVPFLAAALAGTLVDALGSPEQRTVLGGAISSGETIVAVGLTGEGTAIAAGSVRSVAGASTPTLDGTLGLVIEAAAADVVLVPVEEAGGTSVYVVHTADPAVTLTDLPTLDRTRADSRRSCSTVRPGELLGAPGGAGVPAEARRRGCVLLAADATGAATYALELSAEYAKVRRQFGRPIGMFQAVKHKTADMLVAVENARSATYFGAWEVAAGTVDAEVGAAVAKATATDYAVKVVGDAIQVHGGIAITWEHDLHLYLRRVRADVELLGDPTLHLEHVAAHLLDS